MSDQDYTALELAITLFGHSKFNPNQSMRLVIQQLKKSLPEDQYDEVISYLKDGILEKAFTNPKGDITRRAIVNNYNDVFIKNKQIVIGWIDNLKEAGLWPAIRQRPFSKIADPNILPKSIFISLYDTRPYGCDPELIISSNKDLFNKGIKLLDKITDSSIHIVV